ncbi:wings apart-like protein regulation of heterochromatin-domain-containing protein, partial [Ampelomyces quisqualis]
SAFTAPDRRKKVITYGKASRRASIPAPASNNDAPSPERPRKQSTAGAGALKKLGGTNSNGGRRAASRDTTASPDIFDVPPEDEFAITPLAATKRPAAKRRIPGAETGASTVKGSAVEMIALPAKTRASLPKPRPAAPVVSSTTKKSQKPAQVSKPPSGSSAEPPVRRGRTPQSPLAHDLATLGKQAPQQPVAKPEAIAKASIPAIPVTKSRRPTKSSANLPKKSTLPSEAPTKPSPAFNIFDMPSSDDESHIPTPKPPRRAVPIARNEPIKEAKNSVAYHGKEHTESDDSTASRKRKRRGSVSSTKAAKSLVDPENKSPLPKRNSKYQKKADSTSPGHITHQVPALQPVAEAENIPTAVKKPRRTRMRTVPVLTQPSALKANSSPAMLHSMLPNRAAPKPTPAAEVPEAVALEDETMYEIPECSITPVRPSQDELSGSVTPRQKALFGSLLATSSANLSMPSISKLQLTGTKPRSLLEALPRSKSDMTPSTHVKKTRLIASLRPAESSSDEESSESEIESGEKTFTKPFSAKQTHATNAAKSTRGAQDTTASDNVDMVTEIAPDSQTSQTAPGYRTRQKLTYASTRSYLQEPNPEDAFLVSMDVDEPIGSASQTRGSQTDEEEEPSQVRATHELRRQGQNTTFEWENLMLIDDLSSKSKDSIRRSALLELCTKMADTTFAYELLDSSLAEQFLNSLASNGEAIFDFAAAVATIFMLLTKPTYTMLNQIHCCQHVSALVKLLDNDMDIEKTAKNRKTNLSRIALEMVIKLRSKTMDSRVWSPAKPEKVSPQLIAMKSLELLVLGLGEAGSTQSIISSETRDKLVDIAQRIAERSVIEKYSTHDETILRSIFSTLEATSLAKQKALMWSARLMQSLALSMACLFRMSDTPTIALAVKLCMNLTNNKPKACQQFSDAGFVQSLLQSIVQRFKLVQGGVDGIQRTGVLDTLILSLGAMINLTEHSDEARRNADDGGDVLGSLVKTFVEGSARTSEAISMEETQSSVAIGYLSVLVGNLCLNETTRNKVCAHLPGGHLDSLIDKIKEFVQVHEHANRRAKQYEGEEGQETWQNYTARIMLVAEELEK